MKITPLVRGAKGVIDALRQQARKATGQFGRNVEVEVGYTQSYAIYVHENLEARHPVGQAKFLEQPAREFQGELGRIAARMIRGGASLGAALLAAGLRLQRESQKLVPVDTGALKGSAFTKLKGQ